MKTINLYLTILVIALFATSCSNTITNKDDYAQFLNTAANLDHLEADVAFWTKKINTDENQHPFYVQRSAVYQQLFDASGDIVNLKLAEKDLATAIELTNHSNSSYLRALASNYISQHRFKESLELLVNAEEKGDNLLRTQKMLFDVHLELGNYTDAQTYLKQIEKDSGFDYYIRLAKWEDHNGNLDAAISNMEKAAAIAESSNLDGLKQWSYTNLADFYGHAGEIEKSYQHFLMALEIDPQDAYAKKGIAWILYSHENKPEEALAILEHCTTYYKSPDYELLKAEIADFIDNNDLKDQSIESYMAMSENPLYGDMYNSHTAMVFNDELSQPKNAIVLARDEVENRPTPASYDLLAWSYYNSGNTDLALQIIDEKVYGKTFEPAVLYHIAVIFKEVGRSNELDKLKQELIASSYELGPLTESKIRQL